MRNKIRLQFKFLFSRLKHLLHFFYLNKSKRAHFSIRRFLGPLNYRCFFLSCSPAQRLYPHPVQKKPFLKLCFTIPIGKKCDYQEKQIISSISKRAPPESVADWGRNLLKFIICQKVEVSFFWEKLYVTRKWLLSRQWTLENEGLVNPNTIPLSLLFSSWIWCTSAKYMNFS